MRKIIVLILASIFFFCIFRETTPTTMLALCLVMASAYGLSRLQSRYVLASKYPIVGLCLALSPLLIIYPALRASWWIAAAAMFLAFYSIALFLVTTEEKEREIYKEVTGLSLLYGASALNLFLTGHFELMLPFTVSMLLFLFIINHMKVALFVAGYIVACVAVLVATGSPVLHKAVPFFDAQRYALFACDLALLLIAFIAFVKRTDMVAVLAFFGFIYVSVDLLMSVGFRLNGVLVHQPMLGLLVVGPLLGLMMKGGKERR